MIVQLLQMAEKIRSQGGVVVIKMDGERSASGNQPPNGITILISGGHLPRFKSVRRDGKVLEECLSSAIDEYWTLVPPGKSSET